LIRGVDYESWLYETSPSPKAANADENVNTLFTWMTEMLEGSEIDEPMTLTQVVTIFHRMHDGARRVGIGDDRFN
jgi:ATP-dependent DNA helicase Rep